MASKAKKDMSFMEHLEELRWVLVRSTLAVIIMAIVVYFFEDFVFDTLIFGPTDPNFITYRLFCEASHYVGFAESICITELNFVIQNTVMEGQVNVFIWI